MDDYDRLLTFYATSFESPPGPTLQLPVPLGLQSLSCLCGNKGRILNYLLFSAHVALIRTIDGDQNSGLSSMVCVDEQQRERGKKMHHRAWRAWCVSRANCARSSEMRAREVFATKRRTRVSPRFRAIIPLRPRPNNLTARLQIVSLLMLLFSMASHFASSQRTPNRKMFRMPKRSTKRRWKKHPQAKTPGTWGKTNNSWNIVYDPATDQVLTWNPQRVRTYRRSRRGHRLFTYKKGQSIYIPLAGAPNFRYMTPSYISKKRKNPNHTKTSKNQHG
jgi:Ni/Co efflux regulator RcnB